MKEITVIKGRIIGTWRGENGNVSETDTPTIQYSKRDAHVVREAVLGAMIRDYDEACDHLDEVGHGTVKAKDGRTYSGSLMNIELRWDDPHGMGCISIATEPGRWGACGPKSSSASLRKATKYSRRLRFGIKSPYQARPHASATGLSCVAESSLHTRRAHS